jgi:hypothetical protein
MTDPAVVATAYLGLFATRTDVHQTFGSDGWRPVRSPLTPDVIVAGLQKRGPTVGAYLPGADSTTHVLALDIDRDDGWEIARRVAGAMWAADVPAFVEGSRRGAHLWATLAEPVPSRLARRALRAFLADAHAPDDPKIELRPGMDRLEGDGLGHALRLPLMPHGVTGERWTLCWPDGRPLGRSISEIVAACFDVEFGTRAAIESAAERWSPIIDPAGIPSAYRKPRRRDEGEPDDVGPILADLGVAVRPGRAVRCPFHDDRHPSLSIAADGRRVFCKSPECEAHNLGRGLGAVQLANLARTRHPVS